MAVSSGLPPGITTVLFDMDGVLIDTRRAVHDAYTDWAVSNGLNPEEVLSIVHGRRTVEVAAEFGLSDDLERIADEIEKAIADRAAPRDAILPTCELYRSLDPERFAVATSARRDTALTNLEVLGLDHPKVLVTGQDVKNGKPSPDPYLMAAGRLAVNPASCVVIEDAPAGIRAGKAAGCQVVALTTTHRPQELSEADQIVAPEQLHEILADLIPV